MRNRHVAFLTAASFAIHSRLLLGAASPPAAAPPLSLDEAVGIALAHNRMIKSAELDVGKADDRVSALKAQRWPTLNVNVFGSELLADVKLEFPEGSFGTYPDVGPIPSADTTLVQEKTWTTTGYARVLQPLSQLYKIGLGVQARSLDGEVAREKLRSQRQATLADVKKAYYSVVQAEVSRVAASDTADLAREVARVTGELVKQQAALEADQLEARAQLAKAEATLLSAENAVALSKEHLNELLGRDLSTEFSAVPVPEPQQEPAAGDLAALRERARAQRPEARQAALMARMAEVDTKLKRADYLPDVGLSLSYTAPFGIDFLPKNIFAVGLLLDWKVFDGGQRAHELAEKRKTMEQAALAAREAEAATVLDAGLQLRKLAETRQMLEAQSLSRDAARLRLKVAKDRVEAQAALVTELLLAQANLAEADRQYREALTAYWSTRADYERALGEDVP